MIRTVFAMAIATLALAAVSGTSRAAPIAPLGVTADSGQVTQVYWHRGWHRHHCWWRHGYRVCG